MANDHGGYRRPSKPAAVSGPGKYSQRTDGGPGKQAVRPITGGDYGEASEMAELQAAAPMSDTSGLPAPSSMDFGSGADLSGVTGLDAETERPQESVFAGTDYGDGPGAPKPGPDPASDIAKVKKYLPLLQPLVDSPDVPDSVRALYQFVRDA